MFRLSVLIASGVMLFAVQQTEAQQRPTRYQSPSGPTLSPYLLYSRRPLGVVDNYHAFVRPRVQLRSTLSTQDRRISQLDGNVRDVQRDVRTLSGVRPSGVAPTGTGSSYLNYSHYYPQAGGRR